MKTIEYSTANKSTWPRGVWDLEPDKIQWQDQETRLPCLIVRNPGGALCGYVGVTDGHPWFKKATGDVDASVHGGITFADHCAETTDESRHVCHVSSDKKPVWWLGFDCSHYGDFMPVYAKHLGDIFSGGTYKDIAYVKDQIRNLALQARDAAKRGRT